MPLNCAIVGCGRIAPNHTLTYEKNPETIITWACDLVYKKAERLAQDLNIPNATTNIEDVLADPEVDIVNILTDHRSHYALAKQALLAGKNVIVEKPFTLDPAHAQELIDIAHENQVQLICISQHRFDPMINQLRTLVLKGGIGEILLVNARLLCGRKADYYTDSYWHGMAEFDGGSALINQGYHILDILVSFFGEPTSLNAFAARRHHTDIIETEDTIALQFQFQNKALGSLNITSGWEDEDWDPSIEIIGTTGRIQFDLCYPHKMPLVQAPGVRVEDFNPNEGRNAAIGIDYYGDLHEIQINNFVDAVRTKQPIAFLPETALQTLQVIFQTYQSAFKNGFHWGHVERE